MNHISRNEGKTKIVERLTREMILESGEDFSERYIIDHLEGDYVRITYKDSVSAQNGIKIHNIPGTGEFQARQHLNIFALWDGACIPTSIIGDAPFGKPNQILSNGTRMIPLEIVVLDRTAPNGSHAKRHPEDLALKREDGMPASFPELKVELFHKDSVVQYRSGRRLMIKEGEVKQICDEENGRWFDKSNGEEVQVHSDPIIVINEATGKWDLYPQKMPVKDYKEPLMSIEPVLIPEELKYVKEELAKPAFRALTAGFNTVRHKGKRLELVDMKFEAGYSDYGAEYGEIVLSDGATISELRSWFDGNPADPLDKDVFRKSVPRQDEAAQDKATYEAYRLMAELSDQLNTKEAMHAAFEAERGFRLKHRLPSDQRTR
ncbi:MAG: hypothetical protein LBI17_02140 [Rickettsiales bacterium]|jgi:phosphoribosylaminoimidazole-succinocarboxamide synthase|nr:hypothetical protein [Rickettsiales bacterium]